jgi:hypothetical protein
LAGKNALAYFGLSVTKIKTFLTSTLQVLSVVEGLMRSLPKIHRSLSEPILHRTTLQSEDLGTSSVLGGPTLPNSPVDLN